MKIFTRKIGATPRHREGPPRRTELCLGKETLKIFTRKIGATPRHREGPPRRRGLSRRGQLHLGKPRDSEDGHYSLPRQRQATSRRTCDGPGPILGRSRGQVCYYCGLFWGPLCDLFGRVIA